MNEPKLERVRSIIICGVCDAMYSGFSEPDEILPCGHKAALAIGTASCIRKAFMAQDMINWLLDAGMIHDDARRIAEAAGGRLDDGLNLTFPNRGPKVVEDKLEWAPPYKMGMGKDY